MTDDTAVVTPEYAVDCLLDRGPLSAWEATWLLSRWAQVSPAMFVQVLDELDDAVSERGAAGDDVRRW
jgi:hypothetical protein